MLVQSKGDADAMHVGRDAGTANGNAIPQLNALALSKGREKCHIHLP
jgi:hypothetical protein